MSVCPSSVSHMPWPNSRTERPRKPKIGRMEAHHTGNPWIYLEVKRSRSPGRLMLSQTMHHTQVGGINFFLKLACWFCVTKCIIFSSKCPTKCLTVELTALPYTRMLEKFATDRDSWTSVFSSGLSTCALASNQARVQQSFLDARYCIILTEVVLWNFLFRLHVATSEMSRFNLNR